jgi:hypothetical protein
MKNTGSINIEKLVLLILIIFGIMTEQRSLCQSRESLIKAGYIEKFTHFVQWPENPDESDSTGTFKIAVIGKNVFGNDLGEIFSKIKVKDNPVKITYISSIDEIDNCMILFISESEKNNLEKILHYTTGRPILTISDSKGFGLNGVIINMFVDGNYIRYEINRNKLEKSGLKINSLLLNYAVIIKSDG